ncbi:alanine--tRNA ligase [Mucilaginibacter gotjawali]|uniref:Alanine--tRNA ligase n=2 Tax=Mucilaginibacter gotjawali TaxID=1550579 RepID=A0A0X8X2K9_9SPHI|nr:alanine--tRNA ligase [Mucilaginibacter gotjawali]MBB3054184.1 alanyl-tRNA synthetase [Mucilaginibacter gotjawali]BAU54455.1 Alanine--tRNA ligase [Mucilaginibacter gotjawali]
MTASEIRQAFLDFFASKGHVIVPSAPIVIKNDPTLMFTNAGMNQFKSLFLGEETPKYSRVADTQRCLRVSGKHNDLEEVGIDTYHHTMFEMLGNWSFGDYFKKEAIDWSWELLTEVYKIDKDRLYVTYFEGDEKEGLEKDLETYNLWKQYVDESHILPGNKKDNFWEMGETGPCGPCSEVHYDNRPDSERAKVSGATLVNADHDQVIEIWNNVFMQFNRLRDGSLQPLPAKHVDTGMGFERLVRVLQGKTSNYDTDVFQPLIQFIAEKSGIPYYLSESDSLNMNVNQGVYKEEEQEEEEEEQEGKNTDIAMRVIADHIRAISFAIADSQLPSNNKAGYVIRRILRRAVRYSYQYLGFKEPFLNQLVPLLADQFKGVFDELYKQKDFVQKVILEEEASFLRTLDKGIYIFDDYLQDSKHAVGNSMTDLEIVDENIIPGSFAFLLYDTFGFPIDLTELMARENGKIVDIEGFEKALQAQKTRSRAATAIDTGDWVVLKDDDTVEFTGYDETESIAHVIKYRKVTAKGKEQYQIVLDKTPFYAESGGQVGDKGELVFPDGQVIEVTDTKKENGLIVHFTDSLPDMADDALTAIVNPSLRTSTENNHSATHLLHAAMKQVLGTHVNQKGSLVNADYLRFDFSHFAKVTDDELAQIEAIVNEKIRENIALKEERMVAYQEAISSGVTALFGEKYGEYVRVITFDDEFSKELCGGTHVKATGQIGFFKIIAESAVAAGVRRIEAITGIAAENFINAQVKLVHQLRELLKNPKDLSKSVESLVEENNRLKKEIEKSILEKSSGLKNELAEKAEVINGINFIAQKVQLPNADAIKNLAYQLKDIVADLFLVLAADIDGKPSLTVMIAENLVKDKGLNAGTIVRELAKEIKGGGGGQPFFATAGGSDVSGLDKALEKAKTFIS